MYFCSTKGSGDHLNKIDISEQVKKHLDSYRGKRANKFIVYFQNYTNTYDSIQNLKKKYDSALIDNRIVGLQIATRPDCINDDIANLISSYKEKYYVCVELGLQTSNDKIGEFLNRQYSTKDFAKAVKLLNKYNIDVVAHIMVGLPNETLKDIENTVNFINSQDIQGIKIHSTYITKNTALEKMYIKKLYNPISLEKYLDLLSFIITHLRPDIIIHRISGDAPKDLLIAPSWNSHKKLVLNGIDKLLKEKEQFQGIFYKKIDE